MFREIILPIFRNTRLCVTADNEIYLLIKYIKGVLWRVAKRLSLYTERTVPKF